MGAGAMKQAGCSICCRAGRADKLEAQRQSYPRQKRFVGEAVIGQYCPADRRRRGKSADRRGLWDVGELEIWRHRPGRRIVSIAQGEKGFVGLEQRNSSSLKERRRGSDFCGVREMADG